MESNSNSVGMDRNQLPNGTNNGGIINTKIDSIPSKKDHIAPNNGSQQQQEQHQQQNQLQFQRQQQPNGWRVKLYRLNADGSWDDCGTGRILCLYKQKPSPPAQNIDHKSNSPPATNITNTNSNEKKNIIANDHSLLSNIQSSNSTIHSNTDAAVYIELGQPTLCMHSEISNAANKNNNSSTLSSSFQPEKSIGQSDNINTVDENTSVTANNSPRILLRTRILLRDAYQRQGDNIITWCEPCREEENPAQGVDLALSFQDNAGCIDIWRQITQVQSKANEKFRLRQQHTKNSSGNITGGDRSKINGGFQNDQGHNRSLADLAHHANLQQQRQELWANVSTEAGQPHDDNAKNHNHAHTSNGEDHHDASTVHHSFEDAMTAAYRNVSGESNITNNNLMGGGGGMPSPQLPNPPTVGTLEEITDTIASQHTKEQRESMAMVIGQNDCFYLKSLLSLFPSAEAKGDYGALATLAACVKTILLLNEHTILQFITEDELVFEEVCTTLEYDPDLRDKANHRWFLRERAKFRTVALMEDEELVRAIHQSFRVNYLKDTLLRPTMDESSLSTLSSMQTFTHADVVKGVTMSPLESVDRGDLLRHSYLAKVIRILGHEMDKICDLEWKELETLQEESAGNRGIQYLLAKRQREESESALSCDRSTIFASGTYPQSQKLSTIWKQHLAPQDDSMASRRIRRRGSLSFLRELFNMVRVSLHQADKDDFFAVLVSMEVDLSYSMGPQNTTKDKNDTNKKMPSKPVNFLLLLATVLSDPETDVTDKGLVLEIIAGIAMHDPSLIRRKCLDFYASSKNEWLAAGVSGEGGSMAGLSRPRPNGKKQVIFQCPPNDLLASLLFLIAVETDAGVLLQVSEIMRIILDTDVIGDNRQMNTGFADEAEGIPPSGGHNPPHDQHPNPNGSGNTTSTEQNQFLSAFYEHYVQWLAAPFQYTILNPLLRVPTAIFNGKTKSSITQTMVQRFEKGLYHEEPLLQRVPFSALRSSFAVELLSFCVRAHQYRMKVYLLRSRVLGKVLKLIKPSAIPRNVSGDRCLNLAALRFLRAVLSVDEDLYHRHIIQDDLFGPVFEAFRANPVGDNLVSSSIVEMCDFINSKKMNSLIEYIVTKHLSATEAEAPVPSLEDVSSPYVRTLTDLREAYETLVRERNSRDSNPNQLTNENQNNNTGLTNLVVGRANRVVTNEKALEDQRKFREADQEESYFDCDDDDDEVGGSIQASMNSNMLINPLPTTLVRGQSQHQQLATEMHKTSRMFSLSQSDISASNSQVSND